MPFLDLSLALYVCVYSNNTRSVYKPITPPPPYHTGALGEKPFNNRQKEINRLRASVFF